MNINFPYKNSGDELNADEVNQIKSAVNSKGDPIVFSPIDFTGNGTSTDPIKANQGTTIFNYVVLKDTITNENYSIYFENGVMKTIQSSFLPVPDAPTNGIVDNIADTFDWTFTQNYDQLDLYEYSVNVGSTWISVTEKPQFVGNINALAGMVAVRIRSITGVNKHSEALYSNLPFTAVLVNPLAPTNGIVDDELNTFNWTNTPGYPLPSQYEITIDGGNTYLPIENGQKPYNIGNVEKDIGQVGVRLKYVDGVNNASPTLFSTAPYTINYINPLAPTNAIINDIANTFNWTNSVGFGSILDYEYTLDEGLNWQQCTEKPLAVGNNAFEVNTVGVRVKSQVNNSASPILWNATAFTVANVGVTTPLDFTGSLLTETFLGSGIWSKTTGNNYDESTNPVNYILPANKAWRVWAQVKPVPFEIVILLSDEYNSGKHGVGFQASFWQGDYRLIQISPNSDGVVVQNMPMNIYYGIYRTAAGVFALQTSPDTFTWSTLYNYTFESASALNINAMVQKYDSNNPSTVYHPMVTIY
jgi:hypothetical protein